MDLSWHERHARRDLFEQFQPFPAHTEFELGVGICSDGRSGKLQGSPELIPEEGSPPGFGIV